MKSQSKSTTFTPTKREDAIAEAKKHSVAYKEWQRALNLRKAVILEVGNDCSYYRRVSDLINHWHSIWEWECNRIDATISPELLSDIEDAEFHREHYDDMEIPD